MPCQLLPVSHPQARLTAFMAHESRSAGWHMEYAPYAPVVPLPLMPVQSARPSQMKENMSANWSLATDDLALQPRSSTMHEHSCWLGVGGSLGDACQSAPSAGQERSLVLVGV